MAPSRPQGVQTTISGQPATRARRTVMSAVGVLELAAANASGSCPYTAVPDASKVAFWWTVRLKWREGRALSCRHHHRYQSHMTQPSRLFVWPASFLTLPTRPVACLVWIIAVLDFAHAGTLDRTEPATIPSPASTSSP